MTTARILIAGIGHLFMGDDAFGCEVAARLARRSLPDSVRAVDFGIRSLDLTYALLEGYEAVIFIDAMPRGGVPGTLYVLKPDAATGTEAGLDGHSMDPVQVLHAARSLGAHIDRVLVVGCEPNPRDPDADWEAGTSPQVAAAMDEAVVLVEQLVQEILENRPAARGSDGDINHEYASAGGH
jgi:hydrogenase maturation protease